jgi:hypothetical protein
MHYACPIPVLQVDMLRHQAVQIVAARFSRMEPPLRKEVVEYMTDFDSHLWSMRRSKANFFRFMSVFSGFFAASKWFNGVCMEEPHYHRVSSHPLSNAGVLSGTHSTNSVLVHVSYRDLELPL